MDALLGQLIREKREARRELAAIDASFSKMAAALHAAAGLAEYFGSSTNVRNEYHHLPSGESVLTPKLPEKAVELMNAIPDREGFLSSVKRRNELSALIAERDRQIDGMGGE